jgi:hypothetical protein
MHAHRLRTTARLLVAGLLLSLLVLTPFSPAEGQAAPEATSRVRHQSGPYWVWFGPANYSGGGGAYGITITGPGGAVLDLGFSSTLCANGATYANSVNNYFASKRRGLINQGFRLTSASRIVNPGGGGPMYRRQNLTWTRNVGGVVKRGIFQFDYDFSTNVDGLNYCYQRSLGEYSNNATWANVRNTLASINNSLAYSGPGACNPTQASNC